MFAKLAPFVIIYCYIIIYFGIITFVIVCYCSYLRFLVAPVSQPWGMGFMQIAKSATSLLRRLPPPPPIPRDLSQSGRPGAVGVGPQVGGQVLQRLRPVLLVGSSRAGHPTAGPGVRREPGPFCPAPHFRFHRSRLGSRDPALDGFTAVSARVDFVRQGSTPEGGPEHVAGQSKLKPRGLTDASVASRARGGGGDDPRSPPPTQAAVVPAPSGWSPRGGQT